MPYCPKCDMEFMEGVTACTDCGGPLLDSREDVEKTMTFLTALEPELADKFTSVLDNAGIPYDVREYEEAEGFVQILVPDDLLDRAQKLLTVFADNELPDDTTKEEKAPPVFQKSADKYEDMKSSAFAFIVVGALVLAVIILSLAGVIRLPFSGTSGILTHVVFLAVSVIFLLIGILSAKKTGELKAQIKEEDTLTTEILGWAAQNMTASGLDEVIEDSTEEPLTMEIRCLRRMEAIRCQIRDTFSLKDEAYLDAMSEDIYQMLFEKPEHETDSDQ